MGMQFWHMKFVGRQSSSMHNTGKGEGTPIRTGTDKAPSRMIRCGNRRSLCSHVW